MGYTTDFNGEFKLNKPLDPQTKAYLHKFNETRRMKRNLPPQYGVEGEFYVNGSGAYGQNSEPNVIDSNRPPSTQPGLWCQWCPNEEGTAIVWDEGEKFYYYVEWLEYIIKNFMAPVDYVLNGDMTYQGEDSEDFGIIRVVNNEVKQIAGKRVIEETETEIVLDDVYNLDERDGKIFDAMLSNLEAFLKDANKKAFTHKTTKHRVTIKMGEV